MNLNIYQIDAFTENVFEGNPAAVVPLNEWLPDEIMQKIAFENNLSETAFFVPKDKGFHIRWFTPIAEVDLCGHATLAAAHVLFNHLSYKEKIIHFESKSGILNIKREKELLILNFPSSSIEEIEIPENLISAFNITPVKAIQGRDDIMLVFNKESEICDLIPNYQKILESNTRGIICTAISKEYDFTSRFFAPAIGVLEDPVTGSAHTILIPYWAKQLNKTELLAKQFSKRGGILHCKNLGTRVEIGGKSITYLVGEIFI